MASPINVLAFTRQIYHRETNAGIKKHLKLPQSTVQGIAAFLQHYERPDVKSHVTKSRVLVTRQLQDIVVRAFANCVHNVGIISCMFL